MKLPQPTISFSLEGLFRLLRDNRAEDLDGISSYLDAIAEQSERWAATWKNIAKAIQLQSSGTSRRILPDFCVVDALTNIAGRAGIMGYYRTLTKAVGGLLPQDAVDRLVNGIGGVIHKRDAARSGYDELVRRSSIVETVSPAEFAGVLKRIEHLLTAIAELQAMIASAKVELKLGK